MRTALIALCLIAASPAESAEWNTMPGDGRLGAEALAARVAGNTLRFHDGGVSQFFAGGRYSYTYEGGGTWWGIYEVKDDGSICVTFETGQARCDLYVERKGGLVLITEKGLRFPILPASTGARP